MVSVQQRRIQRKKVSCCNSGAPPRPLAPTPVANFLCPAALPAAYLASSQPTPPSQQHCRTPLAHVPRRILTPSFPSDSRSPSPPHTIVPQVSSRHPSKMMHLPTVQAALIAPLTGCDTRKARCWLPVLPLLAQARIAALARAGGHPGVARRRKSQRPRREKHPSMTPVSDPGQETTTRLGARSDEVKAQVQDDDSAVMRTR